MDPQSIGFLVVVILLGGLIAFFADRLGRTLGKRRHSLFGLRPRHTAELLTIAAGIVIPLITVGIVLAVSADMRKVLTEGTRLLQQQKTAQAEIGKLNDARTALTSENKNLTAKNVDAERNLADLKKQLDAGRSLIDAMRTRQATLQTQVKAAEARIGPLMRKADQLTANLAKSTRAVALARSNFATIDARRRTLQASFDILSKNYNELNDRNHSLDTQNQHLADNLAKLQPQVDSLNSDKNRLNSEINDLNAEIQRNRESAEKAKIDLEQQKAELDRVQSQLNIATQILQRSVGATRTSPIIFDFGDEIARITLEPKLTEAEAANYVTSLIRAARIQAQARGGTDAVLPPISTSHGEVSEADQRQGIAKEIATSHENLVIIAYAALNTFKGEPVAISIKTFRNPVVYQMNQAIDEIRVDGRQTVPEILRQLNDFVAIRIRAKVQKDHMIPHVGADEPIGAVPFSDLLDMANAVRADDRVVRVTAYASGITRAADTLSIFFKNH